MRLNPYSCATEADNIAISLQYGSCSIVLPQYEIFNINLLYNYENLYEQRKTERLHCKPVFQQKATE